MQELPLSQEGSEPTVASVMSSVVTGVNAIFVQSRTQHEVCMAQNVPEDPEMFREIYF